MPSSSEGRFRRIVAAASLITVIAVAVGAVVLSLRVGLPHPGWPHTGRAFAVGSRPSGSDPCAPIVGPAKAYCARGTALASRRPNGGRAAWRLGSASAGVAALLVWRLRHAAGRR
ncbi:hypothetical protein [Streptomyces sp. NPDC002516]